MEADKTTGGVGAPPPYTQYGQQPQFPAQTQPLSSGGAYPPATYPQGYHQPAGQAAYPVGSYPQQPGGYQPVYATAVAQPIYTHQPGAGGVMVGLPPNHACLAWFSCLCCFWPLGLIAVIKSREVGNASQRGDIDGANRASRAARQFGLIAIAVGVAALIFFFIFLILFATVLASNVTRYH